ncbi:general secretion pathway protein GspB [Gallaecimonas kandeliae]|uniref:general secretion pathway protein GspB n=1 Tax=Gallaecimonas kandeliae TaxID=3029055 RepID=UPI0026478905|nr:general secretion pathway protein GspB [Gallaecimonas kandeliae]WKE65655.1 general secretion pathway protein GspB [Gallaecimonas kandeliae]
MSYILDVLKQSERQRQEGQPGANLVVEPLVVETQNEENWLPRPFHLLWLLLFPLIYLLWPDTPVHQPEARTQPSAAQHAQSQVRKAPVSPLKDKPQTAAVPTKGKKEDLSALLGGDAKVPPLVLEEAKPVQPKNDSPALPPKVKALEEEAMVLKDKEPAKEATAVSTAVTETVSEGQAAPVPQLPSWRELPVDIQRQLPALNFSVHLYSPEPDQRLVKVNGHLYREGNELAPGLDLEEITPTGVILHYQDWRFTMAAR